MKRYQIKVEGVSPLLMNRWSNEAEVESGKNSRRNGNIDRGTPREQAEKVAYRNTKTQELFIPGTWFAGCFKGAASYYKQKGTRKNMKFLAGAAFLVEEDAIGLGTKKFEVDSRPVVIPATKGRIMRHRPRLDKWKVTFHALIDDELIDPKEANQFLCEGGKRIGVGDFRPERSGPFGRYIITGWRAKSNGKVN